MTEINDVDKARQAIEADKATRIEACTAEIKLALEKHRCQLDARAVLRAGAAPEFIIAIVSEP